jgi:hypothetical protein
MHSPKTATVVTAIFSTSGLKFSTGLEPVPAAGRSAGVEATSAFQEAGATELFLGGWVAEFPGESRLIWPEETRSDNDWYSPISHRPPSGNRKAPSPQRINNPLLHRPISLS